MGTSRSQQGRLEAIPVPGCLECSDPKCNDETHSVVRDSFVLDTLSAVIESSHATIPMVGGRPGSVRPDSGNMPGWREEVEPARKDSVFWHAVWQSAGRPTDGELYNIMKRTRSRYHTAIRKVRRAAEQIKAQKLLEASVSGGSDLMNELKKARGGKHTPDLPENVAGANGEEEICEKFRSVYNELYNSAGSGNEMNIIKQRV